MNCLKRHRLPQVNPQLSQPPRRLMHLITSLLQDMTQPKLLTLCLLSSILQQQVEWTLLMLRTLPPTLWLHSASRLQVIISHVSVTKWLRRQAKQILPFLSLVKQYSLSAVQQNHSQAVHPNSMPLSVFSQTEVSRAVRAVLH